ncbi:hypothetical protein CGCSCA4_v010024 [Colletotrichum siamense]|uniref:Uncharacterized protein n=1 Tax=Colletotrichum siamense TaxID=690259 RepID=A0A9P5EQE0_COLSI|nr:hypothetical protein CGCSCA4_v010024 [Colletotrichum siamense]KAF4857483.1 hypothetical protein CGCSCA2_v008251 [Colletotrichum siamense]
MQNISVVILFFSLLAWGVFGQITLTPSTIDRTRTTTVTKTVTQISVSLTTSIMTTATTSTATVTAPITYREITTVVATKTATTTQTTTQTTTVPCSLVNCPKITSTGTICKSCFVAQCTTTSTVTRSCGCSSALATTTVDFGCEQPDVCNRIGCRTVFMMAWCGLRDCVVRIWRSERPAAELKTAPSLSSPNSTDSRIPALYQGTTKGAASSLSFLSEKIVTPLKIFLPPSFCRPTFIRQHHRHPLSSTSPPNGFPTIFGLSAIDIRHDRPFSSTLRHRPESSGTLCEVDRSHFQPTLRYRPESP